MQINALSGRQPVYGAGLRYKPVPAEGGKVQHPSGDKVEISEDSKARYAQSIVSDNKTAASYEDLQALEPDESGQAQEEADEGELESTSVGGCMGINAQKLARMLAAAKTRSQVQSVIAMIQSDIKECDQGAANGYDVDEASYKAAEQLLQQAKSQLASADNREATPQEEMAQAMASLF